VYDQIKKIITCEYRGAVSRFVVDEKRFNKVWGSGFIFVLNKNITDKKVNNLIDVVMLLW